MENEVIAPEDARLEALNTDVKESVEKQKMELAEQRKKEWNMLWMLTQGNIQWKRRRKR